jgi:multicomponent Na+:H+ antiporter subunit E
MTRRATTVVALAIWCFIAWSALIWTPTVESSIAGAALSVLVAWLLASLGPVVRPWRMLMPGRLPAIVRLTGWVATQVVRANVRLARRIWTPSLPLATGVVVVPTRFADEGRVGAVGIISSLVVDNQIIDLDRSRRELVYHCIVVPAPGRGYEQINGPLERRIAALTGADDD